MSSEVISFSDFSDVALTIAKELEVLSRKRMPVQLLTDRKSLFQVLSKWTRTTEKRMMIDIAASLEFFRHKIISDILFARTKNNDADGPTKVMKQAVLQNIL